MLYVYSIFQSVEGEVNARGIGAMSTFIRLAGCSVGCSFCDTEYAKDVNSGAMMSVDDICNIINNSGIKNVTITGGEPLQQRECLLLIKQLGINGFNVSVETSGEVPFIRLFDQANVSYVVDIKPNRKCLENHLNMKLTSLDIIKQVVSDEYGFVLAINKKIWLQKRGCKARFAFSPEYGKVKPNDIVKWMKKYDATDAILNVQLHKILNLEESK